MGLAAFGRSFKVAGLFFGSGDSIFTFVKQGVASHEAAWVKFAAADADQGASEEWMGGIPAMGLNVGCFWLRGGGYVGALLAVLFGAAGCTDRQSGNDAKALYGYAGGKHVFIVSHLFDASIYNDTLNADLRLNPELRDSPLLTCFYELQLSSNELEQCSETLGSGQGSRYGRYGGLSEIDVWKLMVLREDRLKTIAPNVILRDEFLRESRTVFGGGESDGRAGQDWCRRYGQNDARCWEQRYRGYEPGPYEPRRYDDGYGVQRTYLSDPSGAVPGLSFVDSSSWDTFLRSTREGLAHEVACYAAPNLTGALTRSATDRLVDGLGVPENNGWRPFWNGVVGGVAGALISGATHSALDAAGLSTDRCVRGLEQRYWPGAPRRSDHYPTRERVQRAIGAVDRNDVAELQRLLDEEVQSDKRSLSGADEMRDTLAGSSSELSEDKLRLMREAIVRAAERAQRETRFVARGACIQPERFARDVLVRALDEVDQGEGSALLRSGQGCRGGYRRGDYDRYSDTRYPYDRYSEDRYPTGRGERPSGLSPEQRQAIEALERARLECRRAIEQGDAGWERACNLAAAETPSQGASAAETLAGVISRYGNAAPPTCTASNLSASLVPSELENRLATCKNMSTSTASDTYGNFSESLRQSCSQKSDSSATAQATCWCSCRWSTSFYNTLSK